MLVLLGHFWWYSPALKVRNIFFFHYDSWLKYCIYNTIICYDEICALLLFIYKTIILWYTTPYGEFYHFSFEVWIVSSSTVFLSFEHSFGGGALKSDILMHWGAKEKEIKNDNEWGSSTWREGRRKWRVCLFFSILYCIKIVYFNSWCKVCRRPGLLQCLIYI